ncbi:MAG: CpaF family protein [Alphaproteobacteria bacterium]
MTPGDKASSASAATFGKKASAEPIKSRAVVGGALTASKVASGGMQADLAALAAMERTSYLDSNLETADYRAAKAMLISELLDQLDFQALETFPPEQKRARVSEACDKVLPYISVPLTAPQLKHIKRQAMDEILGFGPLEPVLADPDVNDIMINTSQRVFIERQGRIILTDITFNNEQHLLAIVQRIVSRVGRRIDEANPMVDARMPDGSRFNAIIPPLALDGALVSIRKFKKSKMPLTAYIELDSMNKEMADFLAICSAIRLNVIISGGTGSGKTTLLNALSGHIDHGERVITIEDAAELRLDQPHVLRLETRPSSTEGKGEITQRALVKNALRMRPDRIILGEMRGEEVIDVLSAMNTGHDGSMATIHANSPKDCLSRIENLVAMSSVQVQASSLRYQIASAIQIIVQIQRMRDGRRRITAIEEIIGCEDGMITTQTLFSYRAHGMKPDGYLDGEFVAHAVRPALTTRAEYFGRAEDVLACFVHAH